MELQDQMERDWSRYYWNQPPLEFDTSANHHFFHSELKSNSAMPEKNSDHYCSIWADAESTRVQSCNSRSFAMDARIRLDHLKSGCKSALDKSLYNFNCQKDSWDRETNEEESALDLVELLDVEDYLKDEESWLYESPKKQAFVEINESALQWCRHVLDNPSPEMKAACRVLTNRLEQKLNSPFCKRPAVFHRTGNVTLASCIDKTSVNATNSNSDHLDNNDLSVSHESITTNYRLQDITDVHIMACLQEASLRQDYISIPAAASHRRISESPPSLSSLLSSPCQSPTSVAKHSCQSPKLARLHQQVTQFKLLKLVQNQGTQIQATSADRTRSPLRTSLRSLQAVRNSRSLETEDCHPADQIDYSPPGVSPTRVGLSCWSPSHSVASMTSSGLLHSVRDSSVRTAAIKRLHRSQSLSPCRIPHPAKGHLSLHGRVFASPQTSTTVAWTRNKPSTQ